MKCLILAGGYGTRLGLDYPKPLVKVGSKPVIGHIVDALHAAGVTQILAKIHYLPEKIPEYLGENVLYYYESQLRTHPQSIQALKAWLEGDHFFVINGDTITNVDYKKMIRAHVKGTITVLMDEWRAAGSWIYDKTYFDNPKLPVIPYRPKNLFWTDIGTPERLKSAQDNPTQYERK